MKINERLTAIRITQFVFGVLLGFPLALFSLFMVPNIEMVFSEDPGRISNEQYLRHYFVSGAPVIGYIAMVLAFFRKKAFPRALRFSVLAGLGIGLIVPLWMLFGSLQTDGTYFWDYTSYGLRTVFISSAFCIPLIVAGTSLMLRVTKL